MSGTITNEPALSTLPPQLFTPEGYIVNGGNTEPHEFPYQVRLGSWNEKMCGGTIIHTMFILTAAHCLKNATKELWKVYAGDHNRFHYNELVEQNRTVSHVYSHEDFNNLTFENDIALLVLSQPLDFNEYVNSIPYPRKKNTEYEENVTVSGWGRLWEGGPPSDILQKVTISIISKSECQKRYKRTTLKVTDDMLCAGRPGRDSCYGDSGGPLTCIERQTHKKVVCGVVSFGIGCGRLEFPGVYTDVSKYWQWMELTMVKHLYGKDFLNIGDTTGGFHFMCMHQNTQIEVVRPLNTVPGSNCKELRLGGHERNGVYHIQPILTENNFINSNYKISKRMVPLVYCDMEDLGGGWTIIQRRGVRPMPKRQRVSFNRTWIEYESGFGSVDDDHWIGLRNIHSLTRRCENELKITLTALYMTEFYGIYSNFQVSAGDDDYRLTIGEWNDGTFFHNRNMMERNNGMKFTTFDNDNDKWKDGNCAVKKKGAWWHDDCSDFNLNGEYPEYGKTKASHHKIHWYHHRGYSSYMKSEMKIRPKC